jgi:hypothetical protein
MDYDINGTSGDWGPETWLDPTGTTANNGPQVMANDVLTQSTVSNGQDKWTGFFQNLIGNTVKYAVQRDAARSGLTQGTAANGQPIYTAMPQQQAGTGLSTGVVLLVLGGIVAAVFVASSNK